MHQKGDKTKVFWLNIELVEIRHLTTIKNWWKEIQLWIKKIQINGRQYYVQKGGLNGFWFIDTYSKWMLGPIQKLGEDFGGIQSFTMSPLNGKWKYFKDGDDVMDDARSISIQCQSK